MKLTTHWFSGLAFGLLLSFTLESNAQSLVNPGFEAGLTGWNKFNNAFGETAYAHSGQGALKMFGNWSGPWNASGVYQTFAAQPGEVWSVDGFGFTPGGDKIAGQNFAVLKLSWRSAGDTEISGIDSAQINSSTVADTWHPLQAMGTAPAGTVGVQVLALFLQPNYEAGSAWFDDLSVTLVPEPSVLSLFALGFAGLLLRRRM